MSWRRRQLTALLRDLRERLEQEDLSTTISLSPGPFRHAYNLWLQDWELWALGELIDELVVQNYAYSVNGFARDLDQPAVAQGPQLADPNPDRNPGGVRTTHHVYGRSGAEGSPGP